MAKKKKKSHWVLKTIAFPFKVIWKAFYYLVKGCNMLAKVIVKSAKARKERIKLEKIRPHAKATLAEFKESNVLEGKLEDFEKTLYSNGRIGIILGGRGNGKSALGMRILENIKAKTRKKVGAWGFNETLLPEWIKPINHIDEIENDSFVLIDESGISFSSRNSMSELNKLLTELILITRHKNLSIIFITQNSSNIEVNILRQADYLMLKPHSLFQLNFERRIVKDIYSEMDGASKTFKDKSLTYVYSGNFKGFISNSLPGFWSEKTSKSFSSEKIEEKKAIA